MERAIAALLGEKLPPEQVAASRLIMGVDRQLIADGTYFVVLDGERIVGSGGWSARVTSYGGDHTPGRDPARLDPRRDAARVRAMYTDPDYARRGIGRRVLTLCEDAARQAGFGRVELVGTAAGEPLYAAAGYRVIERFTDDRGGAPVPLARMGKRLD